MFFLLTVVTAAGPLRVLCYGDSLTAGTSPPLDTLHPFSPILERAIGSSTAIVRHLGLPGWTAAAMLQNVNDDQRGLNSLLKRTSPSLAIILAGTNDLGYNSEPGPILQALCGLHQIAHDLEVPTLAVGIPPSAYQAQQTEAAELAIAVNRGLRAWCDDRGNMVPWKRAFAGGRVAFDSSDKFNRKTLLDHMEFIVTFAEKKQEEKLMGQTSLFDMGGTPQTSEEQLNIHESQEFDEKQKLSLEAELLGIYVSGHPLMRFKDIMGKLTSMSIASIQDLPTVAKPEGFNPRLGDANDPSKRSMIIAGMISESKVILTKKGDKMAFVTFEDLSGKIECLFFPRVFAEFQQFLAQDEPLLLNGVVNLAEDPKKFYPSKVSLLKDESDDRVTSVRVNVPLTHLNPHSLIQLKQIVLSYRGSVPVHFIFETPEGRARMQLDDTFLVSPSPQMAAKLNELLNTNSVSFIIDGKVEELNQ